MVKAPIIQLPKSDKHEGKFIPIVFSHGVGQTNSWFSSIFKDLASQGHIVYSIEHRDATALHYLDAAGKHKYYENMDLSDLNGILQRLGMR